LFLSAERNQGNRHNQALSEKDKTMMNRKDLGFTLVEIIVVLLLISIIAATVFGRATNTDRLNFSAQVDKIRNHVRYPQSMAMKLSEFWGFSCDASDYWIFSGTNMNNVAAQKILPGERTIRVALNDLGVTMEAFTVYFDRYGRPFWNDPTVPIGIEEEVNLTDSGSFSQLIKIIGETGLVE
jgi:prepilin-type N-terminal cleavage/methylation domain-containing protein